MAKLFPEKTFYPSAQIAMESPIETHAFVALLQPYGSSRPDAMLKVDLDENSATYGEVLDRLDLPYVGDELHHFGWNACSSALCPFAPHPHVERRYLIVPGIRSSRLYFIDTKDPSGKLTIKKIIEPEEVEKKTGYSRLHTIHCGPSGVYVNALGNPDGEGGRHRSGSKRHHRHHEPDPSQREEDHAEPLACHVEHVLAKNQGHDEVRYPSPERNPAAANGLSLGPHQLSQVHGPVHHDHADDGDTQGYLIGDHLGGGPQSSHDRVVVTHDITGVRSISILDGS